MKKYLFGIMSIAFAVALVSFTNSDNNAKKFDCTWFVFDDNQGGTAPGNADGVATQAEALNRLNYRLLTAGEDIEVLCAQTDKVCGICVDQTAVVGGITRPVIAGQSIESTLNTYFGTGAGKNDPFVVDYPNQIKEKFEGQ